MDERRRILVVDDNTGVLRFLGDAIRGFGQAPYCVESAETALGLVESERFDGIVVDWQMPGMSGTELARRVRQSPVNAETPIVLLTGFSSATVVQESLEAGVNFFLPKPVSLEQLRNLLDPLRGFATLERRQQLREAVQAPVVCQWQKRSVGGQVLNLSADGARLALEEAPPMNAWVSLAIQVPGRTQPLELTGQVVRVTFRAGHGAASREVGVRFVGLPHETTDWLNLHGAKLLPEQVT